MTFWLVSIQKTGSSKVHHRRLEAASEQDAGDLARALVGGPGKDQYSVIRCTDEATL